MTGLQGQIQQNVRRVFDLYNRVRSLQLINEMAAIEGMSPSPIQTLYRSDGTLY